MEDGVADKYMGNWDQGKYVENDEQHVGICEKCCDAGRGNIEIC